MESLGGDSIEREEPWRARMRNGCTLAGAPAWLCYHGRGGVAMPEGRRAHRLMSKGFGPKGCAACLSGTFLDPGLPAVPGGTGPKKPN